MSCLSHLPHIDHYSFCVFWNVARHIYRLIDPRPLTVLIGLHIVLILVFVSVCLSICLSVCLSVCLSYPPHIDFKSYLVVLKCCLTYRSSRSAPLDWIDRSAHIDVILCAYRWVSCIVHKRPVLLFKSFGQTVKE